MRRTSIFILVCVLAGCGGGGGTTGPALPPTSGGGPQPTAKPTPTPTPSSVVLSGAVGTINGLDNMFTPNDGDTASGGQGQTVDGIPCQSSLVENYHVHAFVGFIVNGREWAMPDGVGMKNPGPDSGGFVNSATCVYYLHTHDASGIVHIEDPSTVSDTTSLHSLGQFFDIWGQSKSMWTTIYTSGQFFRGKGAQLVSNTTYTKYTGSLSTIPLYAHEVIWLESGSPILTARQLPSIQFMY